MIAPAGQPFLLICRLDVIIEIPVWLGEREYSQFAQGADPLQCVIDILNQAVDKNPIRLNTSTSQFLHTLGYRFQL